MNWKDYIKLAKKNVRTRKIKSIFQTMFICVGLLVIVLVNLGIGLIHNMDNVLFNVSQKGKMIHVDNALDEQDPTKGYRKLIEYQKKDNRILYIDAHEDTVGMDIQEMEGCDLSWIKEETRVNLTNERNYLEEFVIGKRNLSEDEIILPKYMFRTINDAQYEYGEMEYVDCEPYIGKTFVIWVPTSIRSLAGTQKKGGTVYEFKIAGVYDNVKQCTAGDVAYINRNKLKEIWKNSEIYIENENIVFTDLVPQEDYVVVVRERKDVEDVMEQLKKLGVGAITSQYTENIEGIKMTQFIQLSGNAIGIIILAWAAIMMLLSYLKDIRNRTSEYGLLKAVGYKEKDLSGILWMETLTIEIRAIMITLIVGEVLVLIINYLISTRGNILWKYLHAGYTWWQILLVFFVGIVIPSIAYIAGIRKIRKIEPIVALKSQE